MTLRIETSSLTTQPVGKLKLKELPWFLYAGALDSADGILFAMFCSCPVVVVQFSVFSAHVLSNLSRIKRGALRRANLASLPIVILWIPCALNDERSFTKLVMAN
jgi:hypothetical protein